MDSAETSVIPWWKAIICVGGVIKFFFLSRVIGSKISKSIFYRVALSSRGDVYETM